MRREFRESIDGLCQQALDDAIGLWQISNRVRRIYQPKTEDELRTLVLEFIRDMLDRGFEAVELAPSGKALSWRNQDPAFVIQRIDSEWKALGRVPNVGEIAWFSLRSSN